MPDEINTPLPPSYISEQWVWLLKIAVCIFIVTILSLIISRVASLISKKAEEKNSKWGGKGIRIMRGPLIVLIWGIALSYILEVFYAHFGWESISGGVVKARFAFIVICLSWMVLRWINEAFKHLAKKSQLMGVSTGTIYALNKLTSFVISIIALLILFEIWGLNIVPLLTFGGIGVAGLAFAAQDIIGNFFGGAMLHFTRNFSIGDEIVIPSNNNFEGTVKEIGWYVTVIEDHFRRPVYFPNALFSKHNIINESRRTHRRIKETVTIRYEDFSHMEPILKEIREKVAAHPSVDPTQSFSITFNQFNDYGAEIYLYFLVNRMKYPEFMKTREELFLMIHEIIKRNHSQIAYPEYVLTRSKE